MRTCAACGHESGAIEDEKRDPAPARSEAALLLEGEVPPGHDKAGVPKRGFARWLRPIPVVLAYVGLFGYAIAVLGIWPGQSFAVILLATLALLLSWNWMFSGREKGGPDSEAGLIFSVFQRIVFYGMMLIGLAIILILSLGILAFLVCLMN
jgi:hypothetical protein